MKDKFLTALLCLWLVPLASGAGWQGFLRLAAIDGGSADTNHPGWMEVQASTLAQISSAGGEAVSGDLAFQKSLDKASPALALACAKGITIASGTLDLAGADSSLTVFLRLNLTNVVLTGVASSGNGSDPPEEHITLRAQIFSWNYTQFNPTNGLALTNTSSLWNFAANNGSYSGAAPIFVATGIRNNSGVELTWDAAAGASYRIYAVPNLTQPFQPIATVTNVPGRATYLIAPAAPAMFYVVEQLPAGY